LLPQDSADTHSVLLLNVTHTFPIVTCTVHGIFVHLSKNSNLQRPFTKLISTYFNVNYIEVHGSMTHSNILTISILEAFSNEMCYISLCFTYLTTLLNLLLALFN